MKVIVLGAGPTGLGAAFALFRRGFADWKLFEMKNCVGGLSASVEDGRGFTWDIGGHVLFSHYSYFDKVVEEALGSAYYEHMRESWIRILKCWVPYPFQNNIRYLPEKQLRECFDGLRNLRSSPKRVGNFHEWMEAVFGKGIVRYFMEPYNKKVWGVPLDLMSFDWIRERISVVDLKRIEQNINEEKDDVSWGPNNKFKFPQKGGTGAIYEMISRPFGDHIEYNHEMNNIDLRFREVTFTNGRRERYDLLINTTPIDLFIKKCGTIPESIQEASRQLMHNSGLIVGIGLKGKRTDSKCWMYFPEDITPFYRVTNFHNYSRYNVPDGDADKYHSFICETSYSSTKSVNKDEIIEETIRGLVNGGMIHNRSRESIVSTHLIDIPYSYPIPTIGRDGVLSVIMPYLESQGVYSRGRFGAWKYEVGNMDHSFMQGVEVIERLLDGTPEITISGKGVN